MYHERQKGKYFGDALEDERIPCSRISSGYSSHEPHKVQAELLLKLLLLLLREKELTKREGIHEQRTELGQSNIYLDGCPLFLLPRDR